MSERYTEGIFLFESGCVPGENEFGFVFPQGDVIGHDVIEERLKKMGGKPELCDLNDYGSGGGQRDLAKHNQNLLSHSMKIKTLF